MNTLAELHLVFDQTSINTALSSTNAMSGLQKATKWRQSMALEKAPTSEKFHAMIAGRIT